MLSTIDCSSCSFCPSGQAQTRRWCGKRRSAAAFVFLSTRSYALSSSKSARSMNPRYVYRLVHGIGVGSVSGPCEINSGSRSGSGGRGRGAYGKGLPVPVPRSSQLTQAWPLRSGGRLGCGASTVGSSRSSSQGSSSSSTNDALSSSLAGSSPAESEPIQQHARRRVQLLHHSAS
jgi:hypothetical protein